MPKQQKEINAFTSGIILNADERDIGIDTPAFSLNINPLAKQGILSGIRASRFITSIDTSSTRVLFPNIYGMSNANLNDVTIPKIDTNIVCIEDIRTYEDSGNYISYIGTQGYKETLTNQYICPHMERLIITQTHLGNDSTTTYGVFTGTAITLEQETFATDGTSTTANLEDYLGAGDYIQLSTATSFKEPNAYEIMEVLSTDTTANTITVKRGAFKSVKQTYASGTTYYVFASRISYNLKGTQSSTNMGYMVSSGYGTIAGNHLKGNNSLMVANTNMKHVVTGVSDQVVFDADAKSMKLTGGGTGRLQVGDSITIYTTAHGNSSNHGSTFKIVAYDSSAVTYYFSTAPVTETVSSSTTFYFEPTLLKNSTFFHKTASSGVGDDQDYKVNDWYMTRRGIAYVLSNPPVVNDDTGAIVQASGNIYTDTNLFGSDLSATYYPYSGKHLTFTSKFFKPAGVTTTDGIFYIGDNLLKFDAVTRTAQLVTFAKGDILYLDNNSDGSSPTEYVKVKSVTTAGVIVERGLYGTNEVEHASGTHVYKNYSYEIHQDIDKDTLKRDTEYELTFWAKLNTGVQATSTIVCETGTASAYDEKDITLTSAAGTTKTYTFETTDAGDGSTDTGDLDGTKVIVQINTLSSATDIAAQLEAAIESANGHNDAEMTAANSSGTLTVTQTFHGESGNTEAITTGDTGELTVGNFTGGKSAEGIFALEVNGGYFDSDGNWKQFLSTGDTLGYEGSIAKPSRYHRYNTFETCNDTRGIHSEETRIIDNIKWRQLSYRFKTPKEEITTDLVLSFGNIGVKDSQIAISNINLCEEARIYDASNTAGFMKSSGFIKNKRHKDLVMYDSNKSTLRVIKNFDKDNISESIDGVESSDSTSMEANSSINDATIVAKNREVHIGFGPEKGDSAPKWLGYLNHKIFGQNYEGLYLDSDYVPTYDEGGINNLDKVCLAGEWECVEAALSSTGTVGDADTILTVGGVSAITHGLTAGDNIIIREYLDVNNSWTGAGVWYVSAITDTDTFVCKRNTALDNYPVADQSMAGDDAYKISYRPFYYYGIKRGTNYIYRITPEALITGATATSSVYTKGLIEKCSPLPFPIESICCSYSKNGNTFDGGYIYALSSFGDKIYRLNMNVAFDTWTTAIPSIKETIIMEYKSFKWSNLRTDGNIGATTEVYDSLAEESTPTIKMNGTPSDIIETKGPISTFDWADSDANTASDVFPAHMDTRLWVQSFPDGTNDTFTDGDRFLFCGKTEHADGENIVYFADRTPPTVARYGQSTRYSNEGDKWSAGPFIRPDELRAGDTDNDDLEEGYVGARALYRGGDINNKNKVRSWRKLTSYDFVTNRPGIEGQTEDYPCTAYNKPYVNWGYNVGWDGNGSKKTAIKVARYGLFQIADNDSDGILDGTGVVIPNVLNTAAKYGEIGRKMSSHAVGLIGSSELNWIRFAGKEYGNAKKSSTHSDVEYYTANNSTGSNAFPGDDNVGQREDYPEYMDANKIVFVCTDMHFGDVPQHGQYTVSAVLESDVDFGAGTTYTTKITTSESHLLQPGDLVYFKGTGSWVGWGKSYYVTNVKDADEFYVAERSNTLGADSGEIWLGGFSYNESGTGTDYSVRGKTREDENGALHYHYAFNDEDKLNGDIFNNHGGFSRLWYTDQNNFGPKHDSTDYTRWFPAFQNLVEQLNWQSGFMIRPFNMDNEGFSKLLIGDGVSIDMPSFPDTIYHTGAHVQSVGSGTQNQIASRLFIASPGGIDSDGEPENSKVFLCEWNFLYPNESSYVEAICINDEDRTTSSENGGPSWDVCFAGTIDGYIAASATTALWTYDATLHPVVELDMDDMSYNGFVNATDTTVNQWYRHKDCLAGLFITIVDQTTGYTQTRKIVGSFSEGTSIDDNIHVAIHYPFAHTPVAADKYFVWKGSLVATAPVRLVREETFRFDGSSAYSQDPTLAGNMYSQTGVIASSAGTGSVATMTTSDFHNLTTNDLVIIDGTASYNGTYTATVTGPKTFTVSHTASTDESGTWSLPINSTSSTANPLSVPLDKPIIKMNFGDLDMRKLRSLVTTDDDAQGSAVTAEIAIDSAAHKLVAGDTITFNGNTAAHDGTYIVQDTNTNDFDVFNPSTANDTTDAQPITTNQWGGIGASSTGSSAVGELRAGLAKWDKGDIAGNAPRYDASDNTRYISLIESSTSIKAGSATSTTGFFKKNIDYRYKLSLIYDGYQEGPLSESTWTFTDTETKDILNINIKLKEFSKRLTAICLYRKDSDDLLYRLVRVIKTDDGWSNSGGEYTYTAQDSGKVRATYETRTGISETNRDLSIKYGLSCELDGYLFVGNCSHNEIKDASNQIFRSKPGKWSTFNWAVDYNIINGTPTAMVAFLGKLVVFEKNTMYRINPQSLTIEDIFEGVGCSGKNSIIVTEYALFFANRQGAYMYDGQTPQKISEPIQSGGKTDMLSLTDSSVEGTNEIDDLSWENTAGNLNSTPPYVAFDSKNNLVYFIVEFINAEPLRIGTSTSISESHTISRKRSYIWCYSFIKQRWDLWELSNNDEEVGKPFTGDDGEVFVSVGNGLFEIQGGTNKMLYTWMTKKLVMDTSTIKKVFNKIKVVGPKQNLIIDGDHDNDSDKLIVSTDKGRITSGSNSTTANITYKSDGTDSADYKLKKANKTAKWLQVKFEEMDEDIKATAFIYRLRSIK